MKIEKKLTKAEWWELTKLADKEIKEWQDFKEKINKKLLGKNN